MTDTTTPIPTVPAADRPRASEFMCPRCQAAWNGLKTCHCAACHRTFTAITAFDKHRRGTYEPDTRHCVDPQTVGLVLTNRDYPCWAKAGENPRRGE